MAEGIYQVTVTKSGYDSFIMNSRSRFIIYC